jgi:hypothetical protein
MSVRPVKHVLPVKFLDYFLSVSLTLPLFYTGNGCFATIIDTNEVSKLSNNSLKKTEFFFTGQ